ncbi:MAG: VOC family protein [Myxococcota bacterium]|nr:VOC family protein [Myxococcota bacterium]
MIGYVTLGTKDLARAETFYTGLLKELGASKLMEDERMRFFGVPGQAPLLAVCTPYDGSEASAGNGTMVALTAQSPEQVDQLYARAIELGATDEGAPGDRGGNFYGGYFRDPDGNKLVAFYMNFGG